MKVAVDAASKATFERMRAQREIRETLDELERRHGGTAVIQAFEVWKGWQPRAARED